MTILSEAEILKHCSKLNISRRTAVVLAHLAHFEQIRGGVTIGGHQWRFRTVSEISEAVLYSPRSVTRAIAELVDGALILRKTIWDPRYSGPRVNAYRILPPVEIILAEGRTSRTERRKRFSRFDVAEDENAASSGEQIERHRNRHDGNIINSEHINEQITELITLPPSAKESQFSNLRDNSFEEDFIRKEFGTYLLRRVNNVGLNSETSAIFWKCLETAVHNIMGDTIEPADNVVTKRTLKYLKMFDMPQNNWLGPLDACAIALWTYKEWHSFDYLISVFIGSYPKSGMMNSYHLEKHAFLVINDLKARQKSSADPLAWLNGTN